VADTLGGGDGPTRGGVCGGARGVGERDRSFLVVCWPRRRGRAGLERSGSEGVVAIDTDQSMNIAHMLLELTIEVNASVCF
jgi:hypothetical protein